ncbi:SDR family oxidoreductase [Lutimonas vermicola]|uniref:SDR family oxidoreductase n=1 Tax=Lutimonas vermicola TaxID=414288 RepID=A0ABU9KZC5_9FLAO
MIHIDLKDQNILVTGASDGIGREIALYLMQMGAKVAVHYSRNKNAAQALIDQFPDSGSRMYQSDFSKPLEIEGFWNEVLNDFERIDSIVLNAGVFLKQPSEASLKDWYTIWQETMHVNLDAPALLTKMGIDHFRKQQGGRFIYMASRAVFRGETEEYMGYAASKGGLVSLARSVARSFGKLNIKSFIIAPGFVKTKMAEQFIADYGEQAVLNELALNKMTVPKDISPLVALMCSGGMDHTTGATIDLNAGSHIR